MVKIPYLRYKSIIFGENLFFLMAFGLSGDIYHISTGGCSHSDLERVVPISSPCIGEKNNMHVNDYPLEP